ncbi:flagellar biosynthesis anti-sigma factor FlgM [Ammoniphilus resinae]|uniref:Negative regulator of flagellin synthesis FlgM n=1 Tax=Ammoniphilus resinae TaxID=861532 RepID=A0ABS4GML3_9BACL|nr:flagellar biosynthesis anti-sigma factor FlgM [Ammoniphilus resinae]MBP1931499.1 negative regulator of flagellin synthesis FlgM [Ammoniphilus resinae]
MRIQDANRLGMLQSYQKSVQKLPDKKSAARLEGDQLEISADAQERLKLGEMNQTDTRTHIQDLKDQLAAGTYNIPSEKIAEKLLSIWKNHTKG